MTTTATTITVDSLPVANTIDPVQDRLLIYTQNALDIQGISRNQLLGLSSQPVGVSDAQTLSNKVLQDITSLSILANNFTLEDGSDTTKKANFILSGITTGTTRSYTLPDVSDTLVGRTATQTLTNKTLTAPTITNGSADNLSLTVDAINEHTADNGISIDGLNIKDGALNTNNSVKYANLLNTIFSDNITTYVNPDSAGGTFQYVNIGGIKLFWGQTNPVGLSGTAPQDSPAVGITFPTGFFNTIQAYSAFPTPASATIALYFSTSGLTTTAWGINLNSTNGAGGSASASVIVLGI